VCSSTDDPEALANWYREHLGLECDFSEAVGAYYHEFRQRELTDTARLLRTSWAILPRPEGRAHAREAVVINYLVPDLSALLAHLRASNIAVEKEEQYDYGHFAWIRDPEGNRIELFQDFVNYLPPDI
jgi:catechol 2,3-dioxygenase-like lactoylglutathione lyase family enzyme